MESAALLSYEEGVGGRGTEVWGEGVVGAGGWEEGRGVTRGRDTTSWRMEATSYETEG